MGLGSVRLLNEPTADKPFEGEKKRETPRMTQAGMPAVANTGQSPVLEMRNTVLGMPSLRPNAAAAAAAGASMPAMRSETRPSGSGLESGDMGFADDSDEDNGLRTVPVSERLVQQALLSGALQLQQSMAATNAPAKAPEPRVAEPAVVAPSDDEEEIDPLEGMAGVQQAKVSSLIDEEVNDLSAQVFGDSFAFSDQDLDFGEDEDDDLAFEFAKAPAEPEDDYQGSPGDIPEDEVHHDVAAAEAALANMMADLDSVIPQDDDEEEDAFDAPTIADVSARDALLAAEKEMLAKGKAITPPAQAALEVGAVEATEVPIESMWAHSAATAPVVKMGVGFGIGGVLATLGAIAALVWLFVPVSGVAVIGNLGDLDIISQVMVIFSVVAAILALVTSFMRLPGLYKTVALGALAVALGALAVTAPAAGVVPLTYIIYGACGSLFLGAGLYALGKRGP